jgi:hypothetical protein
VQIPLFFQFVDRNYLALQQSKAALHKMHCYLLKENQTFHSMTMDDAAPYGIVTRHRQNVGLLLADALMALKEFCATLSVKGWNKEIMKWMLGGTTAPVEVRQCDFVAAFFHLLREPDAQVQVRAIECLEQLTLRGNLDFLQ